MTLVTTQPGAVPLPISGQMSQTERSEKSFKDLNSILWSGTGFSIFKMIDNSRESVNMSPDSSSSVILFGICNILIGIFITP